MKKIAIINTQPSFNTPTPRESVDLALIFGAFEQQVSVFFLGDGVYQLIQNQQPELTQGKDFISAMKTYELYDIDHLVSCDTDMSSRGVSPDRLSLDVEVLSNQQIAELLTTFDHVVTM
jgi:tRNA 2-thiouridine synthesizing protein C